MTTGDKTGAVGWLIRRLRKWGQPLLWLRFEKWGQRPMWLVALLAVLAFVPLTVFGTLQDGLTGALITATFAYVVLTSHILKTTQEQARMAQNPVVGIHIDAVELSRPGWTPPALGASPGDFVVFPTLHTLGTGPALDLFMDGEVSLRHTRLDNRTVIPCKCTRIVDFLPSGRDTGYMTMALVWEHRVAEALLEDLNITHGKYREETEQGRVPMPAVAGDDPIRTHARREPKVTVHVVYRNNLGQDFESVLETYIGCGEEGSVLKHRQSEKLECVVHRTYAEPFISQSIASKRAEEVRRNMRGILGTGPTLSNPELGSTEQTLEQPPS